MDNEDIILGTTKENRYHSIPDFLNRFHVIDQFDWTVADGRGKVLKTYRFPDVLNSITSIRNKFLNFYGLRAGVQLIIQVNSQPFQAGNLLISFLPNARYNDVKSAIHSKDIEGIVSRTGAPRVNLDLMDGTRVDMCVPYASPFVFYNLFTQEGNIGDFYISVYSKLRDVVAAGTVTVTVAARFTDVELAFPIGSALPTSSQIPKIDELSESIREKPTREKLMNLKNETEDLLKRIDEGNFQFHMNTAASSFKQKAVPHMATSNDDDLTHMLSTHSNSSIAPLQMGNTSGDDMSFKEILSIPCYHGSFSIDNTMTSGTNVWAKSVEPLVTPGFVNTDNSVSADYVSTISQLFRKWRGSIKYKFRVIKTKYHSLRVRVTFAPGITDGVVDFIDRDSCYSEIFDLRENNTCEFTVPYVHPFPWLNTKTNSQLDGNTSLGFILFDVHNRMVNPATVTDDIDVIVERCAGPDYELAVPTSCTAFPFDPVPSQDAGNEEENKEDTGDSPLDRDLSNLQFQSRDTCRYVKINRSSAPRFESNTVTDAARSLSLGMFKLHKLPWYQYIPAAIGCEVIVKNAINLFQSWFTPVGLSEEEEKKNLEELETSLEDINLKFQMNKPDIDEGYESGDSPPDRDLSDLKFEFQMKSFEQDTERGGNDEMCITQPAIVTDMSKYCTGNQITHVSQMISRSTLLATLDPTNATGGIHLMAHAFGTSREDSTGTLQVTGLDNLSYFASMYAFARGGVNFRMQATGAPYKVLVNTNNDLIVPSSSDEYSIFEQVDDDLTSSEKVRAANLMQHVINPAVEGVGEFSIPFYSSTFCYSVNPRFLYDPSKSVSLLTLPDTHTLIIPQDQLSNIQLYRNANPDFQFSYLTGPPLLRLF